MELPKLLLLNLLDQDLVQLLRGHAQVGALLVIFGLVACLVFCLSLELFEVFSGIAGL